MSVVAVRVYNKEIEIAADAAITYGDSVQLHLPGCKTILRDDVFVAAAGSANEVSLFKQFLKNNRPDEPHVDALFDYYNHFSRWAKESWDHNVMHTGCEETQYVVAFDERVFSIEGFVIREIYDYHAFGNGGNFALGALEMGASAEEAVDVAIKYDIYCARPITIAWIPRSDDPRGIRVLEKY